MLFRAAHHSWRSSSSSRAATSRSTSTAACASSRWRTSRTSCASCGSPRTRKTRWPGLRVLGLVPGIGPKTAAALLERLSAAAGDFRRRGPAPASPSRRAPPGRRSSSSSRRSPRPARRTSPAQVHAVRSVYGPLLERRYDNVQARLRDLEQIEGLAARVANALAVPRRTGARPAGVDPGARRPAPARRGLPHPLHHALGQGPRVRRRLRHPRRRRQHPVRHGHGQRRPRSRRSGGCSTSPARAPASSST